MGVTYFWLTMILKWSPITLPFPSFSRRSFWIHNFKRAYITSKSRGTNWKRHCVATFYYNRSVRPKHGSRWKCFSWYRNVTSYLFSTLIRGPSSSFASETLKQIEKDWTDVTWLHEWRPKMAMRINQFPFQFVFWDGGFYRILDRVTAKNLFAAWVFLLNLRFL